jgi:hypothetical protein
MVAGAFLGAAAMAPLASAPPANADWLDLILDPVIAPLSGVTEAAGPAADAGTAATAASDLTRLDTALVAH